MMENQPTVLPAGHFFLASILLLTSLINFMNALNYDGSENNFLADNWEIPLILLLITMFGAGWWYENYMENLAVAKGRRAAMFVMFVFIFVFALIGFCSLVLIPSGFWRYGINAGAHILLSGFFLRFSVMKPQVRAILRVQL